MRTIRGLFFSAFLLACDRPPDEVYVAGEGFREVLSLTTSRGDTASIAVGDTLVLHASRESGPWERAQRSTLAADACWSVQPRDREPEVAAGLRWHADPPEGARFGGLRRRGVTVIDFATEVTFTAPGRYRLAAQSSWCGTAYSGDTLVIDVFAR